MNNMIELAKQQVKETVMNALGRLVAEGKIEAVPLPAFNVERPADVSHGDFSCNAAMASAKALRNNPRAIGQMIADAAVLDGTVFEKIEVAGPGFLNFFISPLWFNETVGEVISSGSDYGKTELGKGKRVLVEFVSANPTGPMHIGNARGGALGDSLSSVLQFAGYEVEREFYVNDAGNQIEKFGKSLAGSVIISSVTAVAVSLVLGIFTLMGGDLEFADLPPMVLFSLGASLLSGILIRPLVSTKNANARSVLLMISVFLPLQHT